jgi:hypothetical protein
LILLLPSNAIRLMTGFSITVTTTRPPGWLMRTSWNSPVAISAL